MLADYDEDEAADLAAEDRARQARLWQAIRHPHPQDPDHPEDLDDTEE